MLNDWSDRDGEAEPADTTPRRRDWRALVGDACIVGALVFMFLSIKDAFG